MAAHHMKWRNLLGTFMDQRSTQKCLCAARFEVSGAKASAFFDRSQYADLVGNTHSSFQPRSTYLQCH